ncbi:hypothetical protein AAVH_27420 [Aphelenchoides avenae]|nr:hypothetical protein AAVH_27420 [Aphelenchus avenae]
MRNAFVGAVSFDPPEEWAAGLKELMRVFSRHRKGAMQVGKLCLKHSMNADWIGYLLGEAADNLSPKCIVVQDWSNVEGHSTLVDRTFAASATRKARRIAIDVSLE